MPSEAGRRQDRDPLRTGIFGVVLVVCVILVAFGYTGLPFWPQGRPYTAYFTDAGGITPGNDVYVSGIKVGKVQSVGLAGDSAKVTFTVDRHVAVGDQSLAAIRTDTILGERSISVTPAGTGKTTTIPLNRTTTPYTLASALEDLGRNGERLEQGPVREVTARSHRRAARRHSAAARCIGRGDLAVAHVEPPRRGIGKPAGTCEVGDRCTGRAGRTGEQAGSRRQRNCSLRSTRAGLRSRS